MTSFFEKLKKGMRIEKIEEEPEKTEEKSPKESKLPRRYAKLPPKNKATKKIKIESNLIPLETKEFQIQEPKVSQWAELEEKKEMESETKKPFSQTILQKGDKSDSNRRSFNLQNLGNEEGQLAIDVYQTDSELVIQSTIAGVKAEELDISIEADTVLIKGSRQEPVEPGQKNYFYQECYWGPFSRQIILPEETDPNRAEASMKEGVLIIRIPKIERKKKRKIEVKA